METLGPVALALIPVAALFAGWIVKTILDITKLLAATAAKVEDISISVTRQETRMDSLVASRFMN